MSVTLRPHQVEALAKMHNGCVLYGDVGVGKTITSLGYYFTRVCGGEINTWGSMQTPKDVYVITTAKVRDGFDFNLTAALYGVHSNPEFSTNGVRIVVDSWNNLPKYTEVKNAFFIFDEQRVVGYGAWSKAFIKISRSNEWILLSATPGDTWMDYIPVFIANGFYRNKTDFVDQHVIWKPRVKYPSVLRYQDVGKLVRQRNSILVAMPYERHTKRHAHEIMCDYDVDAFEKVTKKRWHVFENRPLRDVSELFSVMRRVVNSNPSRVETVQRLLEKHPKLIVFYNFDYELEALRTLVPPDQLASDASIRDLAKKINTGPSKGTSGRATTSSTGGSPGESGSSAHRLESLSPPTSSPGSSRDILTSPSPTFSGHGFCTISGIEGYWTEDLGNGEEFVAFTEEELQWLKTQSTASSKSSQSSSPKREQTTPGSGQDCLLRGPFTSTTTPVSRGFSSVQSRKAASASTAIANSSPITAVSPHPSTTSSVGSTPTPSSTSPSHSQQIERTGSGPELESSTPTTPAAVTPKSAADADLSSARHASSSSASTTTSFAVAEWNGHKHEPIPTTDSWLYLVQYRAGAEGWNCIETDAICFYSQTYSYRDFFQAHGRIDRLNTPFVDLHYYYLKSRSIIDKAIAKALRVKKNFNEKDLKL